MTSRYPGAFWVDSLAHLVQTLESGLSGTMAPVCEGLEYLAQRELEKVVPDRKEIVAVGFQVPESERKDGSSSMVWFKLENIADNPYKEFRTSGVALRNLLETVRRAYGIGSSGISVSRNAVLWHSHYVERGPSKFDLQFFPTWLAACGIVYHTPAGTSTVYSKQPRLALQTQLSDVADNALAGQDES